MAKKKSFCKKVWLNKETSSSTGSCAAFYGPGSWKGSGYQAFFEVSDCHCKVRLHKTDVDSIADFVAKIRLLADTATEFANYLDNERIK